MKKLTLSVALLLGNHVVKAQIPEIIDVTTKGIFGRSEMVLYCEDMNYEDLEYFYIGKHNKNYHYVKYTGAKSITVNMSDEVGDTRELCTKQGDNPTECKTVDSFATTYKLVATEKVFQVWISKPNVK